MRNLGKIAINTPTQKRFYNLMQVFHCAELMWGTLKPISINLFKYQGKNTYVDFDIQEGRMHWELKRVYGKMGYKKISDEKFYKEIGISDKDFQIINKYFETNFPNRLSKGEKVK